MNIQEFEHKAESAASLLKVLASRPRLMVLCHLSGGEKSVGEIAELTGMRMSTVSQHLALFRAERVVTSRRDGTTIYYRLANDIARSIVDVLYRAYCADAAPPARRRQ